MKIIELKSSNIKRLKAVELQLDNKSNLVVISGKNGQGKTSILDSIWFALGGKKAAQDKPIREGEEKGEIELNLDGYIVKRTFTDKGSYLVVTNKDGSKYSNPQEFLDFIIGNLSFDPLEFSRMDEKKQITELIKIVGLDLTPLDEKKKKLTEERLFAGREIKAMGAPTESELAEAKKLEGKTLISITDLNGLLVGAVCQRNAFEKAQNEINLAELAITEKMEAIERLKKEIDSLSAHIEKNKQIEDTDADIEGIKAQIAGAENENTKIRRAMGVIDSFVRVAERKKQYDNLTEEIKKTEEAKAAKLAAVKMPIDGLSWDEDKVLYKGIPFNQGSAAEQLRVSMAIAMASNPKLKVILIRDGSLLDSDNLKVIEEMAKDKDFQIWLETVDDTGKIGIYIEDGEIKKINK